jgi:hypothetical protein
MPPLAGSAPGKASKKGNNAVWEGKDKNGGEVQIKKSSSCNKSTGITRNWVILWHRASSADSSKQLLQIILDKFVQAEVQKAIDFMIALGKEFAGTLDSKQVLDQKKKAFMDGMVPEKAPHKRPAAAESKLHPQKRQAISENPGKVKHEPTSSQQQAEEYEEDELEETDESEEEEPEDDQEVSIIDPKPKQKGKSIPALASCMPPDAPMFG